jgi:molybdopterin-binding protein
MALLEDLQRLLHRVESATVFVTHDRAEAQALGDRLAVLMGGRLRQEGSPEEVFSTPSSEEVAAFVGVENILAGRVDRQSGGVATVAVGSNHVSVVGGHALGEKLVVGIRPEAVVLEAQVRQGVVTSALNRLPGTVVRITPLGPLARVSVDCGFPLVSLITGQSVENLSLSPGAGVVASFKASAVHVIRRESGR